MTKEEIAYKALTIIVRCIATNDNNKLTFSYERAKDTESETPVTLIDDTGTHIQVGKDEGYVERLIDKLYETVIEQHRL